MTLVSCLCFASLALNGHRAIPAQPPATAAAAPDVQSVTFTDTGQRINDAAGRNVVLADFNGDGKPDAFIANERDYRVYFCDGKGKFTDSGQKLKTPGEASLPSAGDIDGDGRIDVVTGKTAWINDGQGRFTARKDAVATTESGKFDGKLADLNGDGHLDIFAIRNIAAMRVFLNDGHGRFRDTGQRLGDGTIGNGQVARIALGDIDGNGTIDAVTGGWLFLDSKDCPNHVWLNDGKGNFRDSGQLLDEGNSHVHGLALGDLNGDGHLDLVMGLLDLARSGRVYMNDGHGRFIPGQNLEGGCGQNVAFADFNGDHKLDVIIAHSTPPNRAWLNDGTGKLCGSAIQLGGTRDVCCWDVATGEFNGDGRPDAFIVGFDRTPGPSPEHTHIWLNTPATPDAAGK